MPYRILQLNSASKFVGEAAHTLNLTEALREAGHQVWLGLRQGFRTWEVAQGQALTPLPLRMPHRLSLSGDLHDLRALARLIRNEKIQLVHAHRGKDHWLAILTVRLFRLPIPVIRTRHVVTPLKNHPFNRWLVRQTKGWIAVSRAVEDEMLKSGMFKDARVERIPGGINLRRFRRQGVREQVRDRLGIPPQAPVAVCVARFAKVKAHGILLQAWRAVREKNPQATLLLIGDGAFFEQRRMEAREQGLETAVRFLGRLENPLIPAFLEAADLGVISSTGSEGFSRAVLEYMAMELPVVGTRVGALPDMVEDQSTGYLVAPGDERSLAEAMAALLGGSPHIRQAMGRLGRERAETFHGFTSWVKNHEKVYQRCLGCQPPIP